MALDLGIPTIAKHEGKNYTEKIILSGDENTVSIPLIMYLVLLFTRHGD